MGYLDIFIIAILILGIARGLHTGFILQATNLAGIVLAFVLAVIFMDSLGLLIETKLIDYPGLGTILAFLGIFVVVKVGITFVSRSAKSFIDALHLGGVDNLAGGLVGGIKAGIVLSLIFVTIGYFRLPDQKTIQDSTLYSPVYQLVPEAWSFIVDRSDALDDIRDRVERRSEKSVNT
ncbi:MAG: CvpA family protein [Bacteroidetes bacterium]|nr:CvpA family protein [Bacteroidota bacterium]